MDKDTNKNIKDIRSNFVKDTSFSPGSLVVQNNGHRPFLNKAGKLITALYMVTDMMDKEEPIRHKLRTLGAEIISDMHLIRSHSGHIETVSDKLTAAVSFLNVAGAMSFISEMNCAILKKEFLELNRSISENKEAKTGWLEEFLSGGEDLKDTSDLYKGHKYPKGHTRIGVQKGSTLMKALSSKTHLLSGNNSNGGTANSLRNRQNFDILKNKRRNDIIAVLKGDNGGMTIKDIRAKINVGLSDTAYSEKTLQRELLSMTKDGILNRAGEKRWSRYSLRSRS